MIMERTPYKFLDYYEIEDKDIFFGRERETEILLSEIIVNRLVVLFAKTGTGKTSLINAGVRPHLRDLDYKTLYLRVEKDPAEAVRKALREEKLLPSRFEGKSLATQLEHAVTKLQKPIVLFFDQFEEFFIHISGGEDRRRFISDIAEVYHNRESGVHILFSMREEYFHELDDFRDEIPSIFHKGSNLRLHWFDENQARDAIVLPAQKFGVEIEEKLVEQLINDLAKDKRIEPARLQIVCDTLWRERANGRISLEGYLSFGEGDQTPADRIYDQRLEEDIDQNLDDRDLELFEKLLPQLRTEHNTKAPRGLEELAKTLNMKSESLSKLAERLQRIHLIRESTLPGYIEWRSDYLADRTRTSDLQKRVRAISLRRVLRAAMHSADELRDDQALELLAVALQQPVPESETLEALEKIGTEGAIRLLERSLQQDASASRAIDVLRQMGKKGVMEAIDLLEMVLQQESAIALQAGMALNRIASVLTDEEEKKRDKDSYDPVKVAARQAKAVLAQVLAERAKPLFLWALECGLDMRFWFAKASENGVEVWEILREKVVNSDVPIEQAENTIRLLGLLGTRQALELLENALQQDTLAGLTTTILGQMETKEVVELWESVLQQDHLASQAEKALERILESRTAEAEVKDKARGVLDRWRQAQGRPIARPRRAPMVEVERLSMVGKGLEERDWDLLLQRIKQGRCTPFLGAGINFGVLPQGSQIALEWAQEHHYPLEDARDLSRVAQFLAVQYDPMFPKEEVLKRLETAAPPDFMEPDEPHGVLADLPLPVYITTNYDDLMVQALESRNKDPKRELCRWNRLVMDQPSIFESEPGFRPTEANPVVFHLHGHDKAPESLVLTEDDYLDFLVNISRDPFLLPPRIQEALTGTSLLFIGYSLADWDFRVLFRGLVMSTEPALRRITVIQQLPPLAIDVPVSTRQRTQRYLYEYLDRIDMRAYWGTAREFAAELRQRWEEFSYGN